MIDINNKQRNTNRNNTMIDINNTMIDINNIVKGLVWGSLLLTAVMIAVGG